MTRENCLPPTVRVGEAIYTGFYMVNSRPHFGMIFFCNAMPQGVKWPWSTAQNAGGALFSGLFAIANVGGELV